MKSNDWLTKVDIKDAYLHVPLHPEASQQLGIHLRDGSKWSFKAMPFGLNIAPLTFTRLMRTALKPLRQAGIRLVAYLDDILIMSESKEQAIEDTRKTIRQLEKLGFVINSKKSILCPSRELEFLGSVINTRNMNLSVPKVKMDKVRREARQILCRDNWPAKKLAATIGLMNSICSAMSPGMLMTRYLLANLTKALAENAYDWNSTRVKLWEASKEELAWWIEEAQGYNGREFSQPKTELTIFTDASEHGWGGICGPNSCSGSWQDTEYSQSSNMRELMAIRKVIEALQHTARGKRLLILSDNITAVANVVKEGGNRNTEYIHQLKILFQTLKRLDCSIVMRHVPGKSNVFADAASRRVFKDEYHLSQRAVNQIIQKWGSPSVDMFATCENKIVRKFFSWKADPGAAALDAFRQAWTEESLPYAHPPVRLIPQVIQKFRAEQVSKMILVLPHWPSLPIWPSLMELKREHLVLAPNCLVGPPNHRLAMQNPRMIALLLQA